MVGITVSPEQVRKAPPEIRRWLEQQVAEALGLQRPLPPVDEVTQHLVGCDIQAVRAVLSNIQSVLPMTSIFFELAREPAVVTPQGVRVLSLDDMMRNCRLQAPNQVVACLETINQALQHVSGDTEAVMIVLDKAGHCLVPNVTARNILYVWHEIVAARGAGSAAAIEPTEPVFQPPYPNSVPPPAVTIGALPG